MKINKEKIRVLDVKRFILEKIMDEVIILSKGTTISFEDECIVSFQQEIDYSRVLLTNLPSCKKVIRNHHMKSFFEALSYMCFIMEYHNESLDKNLPLNAMFFDENGYRGLIGFYYDFYNPKKEKTWYIKRINFQTDEIPQKIIKVFY